MTTLHVTACSLLKDRPAKDAPARPLGLLGAGLGFAGLVLVAGAVAALA